MKTKRIKNKKKKNILILDLVVLFICICRSGPFFMKAINVINAFKAFGYSVSVIILLSIYMLWLFFMFLVIQNIFIIAIYLAYRIPRKRMIKQNSKYEVIDNITYYRERFKGITPSEISLITDLEVETKKDFTATILDLYNRKYIDFEGNKIVLLNKENEGLKESESYILDMLKNSSYSKVELSKWKELCIREAIDDNLIVENKSRNLFSRAPVVVKWGVVFFFTIIIGVCYVGTPLFSKTFDDLKTYEIRVEGLSEDEIVELIKTDKEFHDLAYNIYVESIPLVIIGTFIFIPIMALIAMPTYLKARIVTYRLVDSHDKYDRTKEGKILVEQIAGMKNLIHDFSILSEREKESVKLWDDFLIYAIVLEENDKIVKDISKYQSVDVKLVDTISKKIDNIK